MKEKMVKRILSFLLTVALCIPMVLGNSMEAKAASEFADESKAINYSGCPHLLDSLTVGSNQVSECDADFHVGTVTAHFSGNNDWYTGVAADLNEGDIVRKSVNVTVENVSSALDIDVENPEEGTMAIYIKAGTLPGTYPFDIVTTFTVKTADNEYVCVKRENVYATVYEEEAPDNSKLCEYCGEIEQYYEWYTPYADYHVLLKYYGCCYKSIEDDSTKAEHDFSEGRCTECGYQEDGPICEHADCDRATDGTESGTCSRCGSCVTYIISSNADTHTYVYKCNGCGSILEDLGTVTEAHKFYGNIYCVLCGYYNSKPSGNVAEESTPSMTEEEIAQMKAEEITLATEAVIQAEVAIPVTDFVSAEAVNALPAEVKDSTGDEAVYNLSKITTTRGFVAAVEKMVEANKSSVQKKDTVVFYTSAPIAFNTSSLTALSNAATEFVYMFKYEGHLYKVTIPAGAKVDLAGQRFAGPLYIGAQLGTSVLVK